MTILFGILPGHPHGVPIDTVATRKGAKKREDQGREPGGPGDRTDRNASAGFQADVKGLIRTSLGTS